MSDAFDVSVVWPAETTQKLPPDPAFSRDNWLAAPNKAEVFGSSPAVFGGDPKGYNPEELLTLSLSQCHLLTYLAMAAKRKISVLHYEDHATGQLGKNADGKMQMVEVVLRPQGHRRQGHQPRGRESPARARARGLLHGQLGQLHGAQRARDPGTLMERSR